ncbi:MAG: YtxH domain-containing protein [Actinomycetota bacterium]|nr:YtxH domain-containing protein [Actinomycetota bacterium]
MRFRLGFMSGMAAGYYLGSKAGRQRYDQINRTVRRLRRSDTFETATDKAKSTLEDGVGKAKDLVSSRLGDGGNGDAPANGMPTRFA